MINEDNILKIYIKQYLDYDVKNIPDTDLYFQEYNGDL